jgi:aryl-alcohol dehydrogenase-like predicted oxidoreductase
MTLRGCATIEATAAYAEKTAAAEGHFRSALDGLTLSSIGLGTYMGQPDEATDELYQAAVEQVLASGCNVIDTAVNYRFQRSERAIGKALKAAVKRGDVDRDSVMICTKGGFVPFDGHMPPDPKRWVYEHYIETGIAHPNDFAATYQHCLAPTFLETMLDCSCQNLGVDTIDLYYLHNPETQHISNTHATYRRRMLDAFEMLERAVSNGRIAAYGVATWTAFRSAPDAPDYLSLTELVAMAFEVAGEENHLCAIQLPYNMMMTEAFALENQQVSDAFYSPIDAAQELGLSVFTSATLKQGLLASPFMADLAPYFPDLQSDAQRAIQFARSTPGVTTALIGMANAEHIKDNLALTTIPPADPGIIHSMFEF